MTILQELCCRTILRATTVYGINKLSLPSRIKAYLQNYWGLVDVLTLRQFGQARETPPGTITTQRIYISWNRKNLR